MTHQTIDATIEPVQDPSKRYRCRHIFIDGHRCGSPSLRGEHLCYYHHMTRGWAEDKRFRRTWEGFSLPELEDRSSVLAAIGEVLQRIACGNLPAKQAGLLLYGLQLASNNLPDTEKVNSAAKSIDKAAPTLDKQPIVEQVFINPRYGDLAPVTEMEDAPNTALEDVTETPQASQPVNPEPSILPNLNASADIAPSNLVILREAEDVLLSSSTHPKSTSSRPERSRVERPLYFTADATTHPPTPATNPVPAKPEINIPNTPTWYPNNCHVYEKRTTRPPHSAHRHQAAQRRRSRRRHALDGLQLA